MRAGPAAYSGRRRASDNGPARIVLVAVLAVAAAVFIALWALPARTPGHVEAARADAPIFPPLTERAATPGPGPASPSPAPSRSSARPSTSPSPSASASPGVSVPPSAKPTRTPERSASPAPSVLSIEAEADGNGRSGQMRVREAAGASGGRAVTGIGDGRALVFTGVDAPRTGDYRITVAYLSTDTRRCYFGSGRHWTAAYLPATGGAVSTVTVTLTLQAGRNTVEAGNTPGRWCPDLDRITVAPR